MKPEPVFLSLLLSLAADFFFLKTPFEGIGILFFIGVQYCHRNLLSLSVRRFTYCGLCGMLCLFALSLILHIKSSLLTAAAFFYISLLFTNLFSAWFLHPASTPLLLRVCLAMLFVCDIHVGLFNLPRFVTLPDPALLFYCTHIADKILWSFYLPSQLIMLYLFFCLLQQKPPAVLL